MGVYLAKPKTYKSSHDGGIYPATTTRFGVSAMQGWRLFMEDAHFANPNFTIECMDNISVGLYAVFDGHGGPAVSNWVAREFDSILKGEIERTVKDFQSLALTSKNSFFPDEVAILCESLQRTFLKVDTNLNLPESREKLKAIHEEYEAQKQEEIAASAAIDEPYFFVDYLIKSIQSQENNEIGGLKQVEQFSQSESEDESESTLIEISPRESDLSLGSSISSSSADSMSPSVAADISAELSAIDKKKNLHDFEKRALKVRVVEDAKMEAKPMPFKNEENANKAQNKDGFNDLQEDSIVEEGDKHADKSKLEDTTEEETTDTNKGSKDLDGKDVQMDIVNDYHDSESVESYIKEPAVQNFIKNTSIASEDSLKEKIGGELKSVDSTLKNVTKTKNPEISPASPENEFEMESQPYQPESCGSTAVAAIVLNGNYPCLLIANAGDSRAVLCRGGWAMPLSYDHKPTLKGEARRIKNAGGEVVNGRVDGNLNLSRALGDLYYKSNDSMAPEHQKITAFPDIRIVPIDQQDQFLILACDGIWDCFTNQDAVEFVQKSLNEFKDKKDSYAISKICETMCDQCLSKDPADNKTGAGCDNMTIMIVLLGNELVKGSVDISKRPQSPQYYGVSPRESDFEEVEFSSEKSPTQCYDQFISVSEGSVNK